MLRVRWVETKDEHQPGETATEDDSNFLDLYRVTVPEGLEEQGI